MWKAFAAWVGLPVVLACGLGGSARAVAPASRRPAPDVSGMVWAVSRSRDAVDAHFLAANVTHGGRLTWEQARNADWPQVANHFAEIDIAGRGWVTLAQVHAFERARHQGRRSE